MKAQGTGRKKARRWPARWQKADPARDVERPGPWDTDEMRAVPKNAVYIEACKMRQAFKKRAEAIGAYVAKHKKGVKVEVNLSRPRKG